MPSIRELLARKPDRHIEEVIKVDQDDAEIIKDEIEEYEITDSILKHYNLILERYNETPAKPHEGIGIWVSGFFGSGKSSFAKILGLALANRDILGVSAAERFMKRRSDSGSLSNKFRALLTQIVEKIPTDAVIFDVSTDRGIRSGNQSMTEIMHKCFVRHLDYAGHIDIAQLEIDLESEGKLESFKEAYRQAFNVEWEKGRNLVSQALNRASRVMHQMEPDTYSAPDSWLKGGQNIADVSPGSLAERCKELMKRRRPDYTLVFVIDEVGQFVARDVQKMLDLQAIVQSLGRIGRGKMWIVVTSQEKLTEMVGGLDDKRVELARLMDRFPLQVHLEPSDISEVTSRRILSKNAQGEETLRGIFESHRGKLSQSTSITADIQLPELTAESFISLYPLLPYQIDLIINVVSGLRTQGGASRHVGGANRTIIKLAQQLLIHPDVALAEQEAGRLARIDQIYDLVSGNIPSELRGKISKIQKEVSHPLAGAVAKAICLFQFVKSIHRTAENIAACLHEAVDADSRLPEVKAALDALEKAKQVRLGDDGYRIPSPAEDDWERQRDGLNPKPADVNEIYRDVVGKLWNPQPQHSLLGVKVFKAGLVLKGRVIHEGDIPFHISLAQSDEELTEAVEDSRKRSQTETKSVFWASLLNEKIDHHVVEFFRSKQVLALREGQARTKDELALVAEEKRRMGRHSDELRRYMREALLGGSIYFRGNDRSPDPSVTDVVKVAESTLGSALPDVFDQFERAGVRVSKQDLMSVLTSESLNGLTRVFSQINLLVEEGGQTVFNTNSGPLAELFRRIENRTSYGEAATGRYLTEDFGSEPYGWDFDVVRLLTACLLRSGKVDVTSQGKVIESALSVDSKNLFGNNNSYRSATFRPKETLDFAKLAEANEHFKAVFGKELADISNQSEVTKSIRDAFVEPEESCVEMRTLLEANRLPGAEVLKQAADQAKIIRTGNEEQSILTFIGSHKALKEAIKRAADLTEQLTEPNLLALRNARDILTDQWAFLKDEVDLDETFTEHATQLEDMLQRESFYGVIASIGQHAKTLRDEYRRRHKEASDKRVELYTKAVESLGGIPTWRELDEVQQKKIASSLEICAKDASESTTIPLIRADIDACSGRLQRAIEELMRIVDGTRVVKIDVAQFFSSGIETEEQLNAAIAALREECERQLGEGKKILIQ